MSDNLTLYNNVRVVPAEAQKEITGGRLKGMTDINPMWRIKQLTEQFGPCGEGWKYEIKDEQFASGGKDEIAVFVRIDLYYKVGDGWSEPIPGTGGSMFVENQKHGPHVNDECIKMALTDAISVACKALGFGADIYWQKDKTKYSEPATSQAAGQVFDDKLKDLPDNGYEEPKTNTITEPQQKRLFALAGFAEDKERAKEIVQNLLDEYKLKSTSEIAKGKEYNEICEKAEVMLADYLVANK